MVESHPYVIENVGLVALMRGPLLYCFEEMDNPGFDLRDVVVDKASSWKEEYRANLLGGVIMLSTRATVLPPSDAWQDRLYRAITISDTRESFEMDLTAVPYYDLANRAPGRMAVWMRGA